MKKAYLGIDIGSISTKGVIIDEEKNILAGIYLWTEGNPMGAAKKVIAALGEKIDQNEYQVVAAGTTGSARMGIAGISYCKMRTCLFCDQDWKFRSNLIFFCHTVCGCIGTDGKLAQPS